ncbi:MAG: hypothetical protein KDC98_18600 [Planctomycetes bacterium]|nr:hypothetical protein [Planctomycetota bacterium]
MRIESHATPALTTPEQRYAALHRAIERGIVSDAVWRELAEVSLRLGHTDEARRCVQSIESDTIREALRSRLARIAANRHGPRDHVAAPAASDAGSDPRMRPSKAQADRTIEILDDEPALNEHLADAVQFLFVQHMPWLCLLTTLAFPLVVGLGGFLTAGTSPLGLAAISALPGVCVLALICAMGRRILLEGSRGVVDPPAFPDVRTLATDALRWCLDGTAILVTFATPIAVAAVLGAELPALVASTVIAAMLAPMAFCICQIRGVRAGLSPLRLIRTAGRGGLSYLGVTAMTYGMFVPLLLVGWYVLGQPLWVQIAAVGPMMVLPVFVVARLLGTWIDVKQEKLGIQLAPEPAAQKAPALTAPQAAPTATRKGSQRPVAARSARPAARKANPAPRPARAATAATNPKPAATGSPRAARAIEGRSPRRQRPQDVPDLRHMPGAVTVSGHGRATSKAAARRP